jgi:hypothetical protein
MSGCREICSYKSQFRTARCIGSLALTASARVSATYCRVLSSEKDGSKSRGLCVINVTVYQMDHDLSSHTHACTGLYHTYTFAVLQRLNGLFVENQSRVTFHTRPALHSIAVLAFPIFRTKPHTFQFFANERNWKRAVVIT